MFKNLRKNKKGFTLVEMIVVIAILAVLAAVLVPTMMNVVGKAEQNAAEAQISSIHSAYKMLLIESGQKQPAITDGKLAEQGTATTVGKQNIVDYFESGLQLTDFDLGFDTDGKLITVRYTGYQKTISSGEVVKI